MASFYRNVLSIIRSSFGMTLVMNDFTTCVVQQWLGHCALNKENKSCSIHREIQYAANIYSFEEVAKNMRKTDYLKAKFGGMVDSALKLGYHSLLMALTDSLLTLNWSAHPFRCCFWSGFKYHIPSAIFILKNHCCWQEAFNENDESGK